MKRHIGKIKNTDQKVIVAYMQIPGREDHALLVSVDGLTPRMEQAVMEIVESPEGQGDPALANVLARRLLPETGKSVLQALHETGLLTPVHVDQIVMLPQPNMPFPLRQIIDGMGKTVPGPKPAASEEKFNAPLNNMNARSAEERTAIARNLLIEAEMLQVEADRKRAQAYQAAPELEPQAPRKAVEKVALENVVTKPKRTPRKKAVKETGV